MAPKTNLPGKFVFRVISAAAVSTALFLPACSSKLKDEYDFRPYIAAWAGRNCGSTKEYRCNLAEGFVDEGFDGEDYVYGLAYIAKDGTKRVVYVKVAARKPHDATVVGDEPFPEK